MTKYSLTERQKNMLRSIAPGLEAETISGHWIYMFGGGRIEKIQSIGGKDGDKSVDWKDTSRADFITLEDAGLIRWENNGPRGTIYLYVQKIIDAVNSNFSENEQLIADGAANYITFSPVFGMPAATTQYKADIFVMMPFKPELKHVYDECMKPAAQLLSLSINRGDDFFTKHTIMTDVWSAICHCRLVIADCTDKNANVFYELGLAHTVGKPVIMIAQNVSDIPFDVQNYRRFIYSDTPAGLIKLMDDLTMAIPKLLES